MVIVHANTVNSPTWKNYIVGKTTGAYEAFKTIMVTVNDSSVALGKPGTINAISDGTDITNKFTDKYFKSYVYSLIGKTSPSPILYSDVKGIKTLSFYSENISNLCGIEYFKALTELVVLIR
ncbi:hypothetical protein [Clostridium sp. FP1]|uniref:hypothetical protein n=1 Tax=Clostridium sp. FP1 TaxID=2724076 RepID=UPI0013E9216C|nr:hypothetical protein [Clostridium sp. FP1]MBZ9632739.1 hypothetical protein [Clostridium sp. FP1]